MAKNTVRVLSRSHTALTLTEPNPDLEKPGNAPALRSVSIAGNGAISEVDADTYNAWKKGNPNHPFLENGILEEVGDDYQVGDEVFGYEPALAATLKEKGAKRDAKAGSQVEAEAGGVSGAEMTPENGTMPSDDPGEPRHASQPGEGEPGSNGKPLRPARKS